MPPGRAILGNAMSQENMETVRKFMALVAEDFDASQELLLPDATLDWSRSEAPDHGVHVGHDAWRSWLSGRAESLSDARFEVTELIDVPPDRVVLVAYMRGTGRASGVETEGRGAAVVALQDERLARITLYQTRGEALKAVGLAV
jgi:ketosteroid isomerase-like protein